MHQLELIDAALSEAEELNVPDGLLEDYLDLKSLKEAKQGEVHEKVTRTIGYLDAIKGRIEALRPAYERALRAYRIAQNTDTAIRSYLKRILMANPGVNFDGSNGSLALAKNPPALRTVFDDMLMKQSCSGAWSVPFIAAHPELERFCEKKEYFVPRKDDIKRALKFGEIFNWAALENDYRLTIKL
jgi:hypothetical protein